MGASIVSSKQDYLLTVVLSITLSSFHPSYQAGSTEGGLQSLALIPFRKPVWLKRDFTTSCGHSLQTAKVAAMQWWRGASTGGITVFCAKSGIYRQKTFVLIWD